MRLEPCREISSIQGIARLTQEEGQMVLVVEDNAATREALVERLFHALRKSPQ
jgi:hypothetical protein